MSEFGELNEEARTQFEGFRPGLYVRLQVKGFPGEFIEHFDPAYPLVVGGLLNQERNVGYITVSGSLNRCFNDFDLYFMCLQVGSGGFTPACGDNGNSRDVSCSKPSLHSPVPCYVNG